MLTKLYKLIFDISICYTLGVFLLNYYGSLILPMDGFVVLILTAMVATLLKEKLKKKWEILIILLAWGPMIFLKPTIPETILFLLVWAYYSYVTIKERFVTHRGVFVDMLKRFGWILLIVAFLAGTGSQTFRSYVEAIGLYLAVSLISAVFLLRNLRTDNQMEQIKLYRRQQFIELVVFLVICFMLTVLKVPQNMAKGLSLMYHHLLIPLLTFLLGIIGFVIMAIVKGLYAFLAFISNNKEIQLPEPVTGSAADKVSSLVDNVTGNVEWILPFLYSVGIIAGLLLVFYFFRWLMGGKLKENLPDGVIEIRESIEDAKDKKVSLGKKPKDARGIVRYYYGKFLLWLKIKEVQLRIQDTTDEISDKYNNLLMENENPRSEEASELKILYQKSRYQMGEEITSDEASKAKKLYNLIKKSKVSK